MKRILLLGAGRSANYLIRYLVSWVKQDTNITLTIGDSDSVMLKKKTEQFPEVHTTVINVFETEALSALIEQQDYIVSLLPPTLHFSVAQLCLYHKKHLLTASYLSESIKGLDAEAKSKDLIFLNELGFDPGIDHLSAMHLLDQLKAEGAEILSFSSYAGGLPSPESVNKAWKYKISWNPRNVILAGQGSMATAIVNNKLKLLPYNRLFKETYKVKIKGLGTMEAYLNREATIYAKLYNLDNIHNFKRGTLRYKGFCKAWDLLVEIGLTNDAYVFENSKNMTYKEWIHYFLNDSNILKKLIHAKKKDKALLAFEELNLLEDERIIGIERATSGQILQKFLEEKWRMDVKDKDMVVLYHEIEFKLNNKKDVLYAKMILKGNNDKETAMSKTVGLPLALALKLVVEDKIRERGTIIPLSKEFYEPILIGLEKEGLVNDISFKHSKLLKK